jgi:hypothetical protein
MTFNGQWEYLAKGKLGKNVIVKKPLPNPLSGSGYAPKVFTDLNSPAEIVTLVTEGMNQADLDVHKGYLTTRGNIQTFLVDELGMIETVAGYVEDVDYGRIRGDDDYTVTVTVKRTDI